MAQFFGSAAKAWNRGRQAASRGCTAVAGLPVFRAAKHRDFRLLWIGAMFSFTGTQIQRIAEGFLVYDLTGDTAKLAFIMFANMVPVSFLGPIFGVFADVIDRRKIMVAAMVILAAGSAFLGVASHFGFLQYWHIVAFAFLSGFVLTVEAPSRMSIVREVVPVEDFATAVPTMSMTFNVARVAGPAIGGVLAGLYGAESCFWINSVSFFALIIAALAIRTDLSAKEREPQPVRDLLTEGMLYTLRDRALLTLFILESVTSFFGIFYISLMPAIAKDILHLGEAGLGAAMSSVGIGALGGLILLASISHKPYKALMIRVSMTCFAVAMVLLTFVRTPLLAFPLFSVLGACTIVQFNTTNTLFQLISPARLRGRVLSMHMWAISGVAPFGIMLFGWISRGWNLDYAFMIGGGAVAVGAVASWLFRQFVYEPETVAA